MPGAKLPILTITDRLYYRDDGMYIDGRTDGTLNITSDSAITIAGNATLPTGKTFTVTDGAVNLGTGALTIGGNATLSTGKYLTFDTSSAESIRFASDGLAASGCWGNSGNTGSADMWSARRLHSGQVSGWMRLKVVSGSTAQTMYLPLFSGAGWGARTS